jgi:U4/U6 small nuclear ribonucleoprotein PRP4
MASRRAYVEDGEHEVRALLSIAPSSPQASPNVHLAHVAAVATEQSEQRAASCDQNYMGLNETDGGHYNRTQRWACHLTLSVSTVFPKLYQMTRSRATAMDSNYNIRTGNGTTENASNILAQLERKRFAQTIAVPTDDRKVRSSLRAIGEPITLFGEGPAERRDRLRELLTLRAEASGEDVEMGDAGMTPAGEEDEAEEEYYTEGVPELLRARQDIARYSMGRARKRILFQKAETSIPLRAHVKHRKAVREALQGYDLYGSQVAADRPLGSVCTCTNSFSHENVILMTTQVRFAPNGETFATGTWSGLVKLLDVQTLEDKASLRGHTEVVSGLSWMPDATLPNSTTAPSTVNLASGGGEGNINLWSLEQDTPLATLQGHESRVSRVEFHPSKRYLASASHDMTWRLWDIETTSQLQLQEGHSREVHALGFNVDGSLLASGGMDSVGRIWDVRSGKMAMFLDSHIQPIHTLDWGPDGYRLLTGSMDGYIKCWDLRAIKETASIGAHSGGVNDLRWYRGLDSASTLDLPLKDDRGEYVPKKGGTFVVSVGFDKMVKIWSADEWGIVREMRGHSSNITGVDVSADSRWVVSCGRDRTVKLWGRDDGEGI